MAADEDSAVVYFHLDSDSDEEFEGFPPQSPSFDVDEYDSDEEFTVSDVSAAAADDDVPLAQYATLQNVSYAAAESEMEVGEDEIPLSELYSNASNAVHDEDDIPLAGIQWRQPPVTLVRTRQLPDLPEKPKVIGENLKDKKPVDFFHLMFPQTLYDAIARETNRYAVDVMDTRILKPKSRLHKWSETNRTEVQAFIGLRIAMGLCAKPCMDDYWSEAWLTQTPGFAKVMSRNRFKLLCSFLHFSDNAQRRDREHQDYDPLFKVRPVLNAVSPAWEEHLIPGKNLAIDESMIAFRGRIFFRQYIKSKHHRFGIKAFVLCCGATSYTHRFDIYTGGMYAYDKEIGQGHSVVKKLTEGLPPGHVLYLDSFYTSPDLCVDMFQRGIGVCGTVTQNRKGMPDFLKIDLHEGDKPLFLYKAPVLACAFHDRKTVRMLSTVHTQETFDTEVLVSAGKRNKYPDGKRISTKPVLVQDYNRFMGGVDRSDQMASYHPFPHRSSKWYMRVFNHIVEICLINARVCYNLSHDKSLSAESFRRQVADALVELHMNDSQKNPPPPNVSPSPMAGVPQRLLGRHFMAKFEGKTKPDCVVCSDRKRKRHQTSHYCKTCDHHPALCDIPCFERYHTVYQYK